MNFISQNEEVNQYLLLGEIPPQLALIHSNNIGKAIQPSPNSNQTTAKIEAAPTLKPRENNNLNVFNLGNESISSTITITTFH